MAAAAPTGVRRLPPAPPAAPAGTAAGRGARPRQRGAADHPQVLLEAGRWPRSWCSRSCGGCSGAEPPAGQKTLSGRNCTEIRGPGVRDLGHGVLPGALAGAAHHHQVAVAHRRPRSTRRRPRGRSSSRRGSPTRDDRDHRVVGACRGRWCRRARPPVAAVAVVAAAGGHERLAELGQVVRRLSASRAWASDGWGSGVVDDVGVHEARDVDHARRTSAVARPATARRSTRAAKTSSASGSQLRCDVDPGAVATAGGARARDPRRAAVSSANRDVWKSTGPQHSR